MSRSSRVLNSIQCLSEGEKNDGMLKNVTPNADGKGTQPGGKHGSQKPQAGGQLPMMKVQ